MAVFPDYSEEHFLCDVKKWVDGGGSAKVVRPQDGYSLLHQAAEFQDVAAIEYLIEAGCDPNQHDIHGQTPLHIAVDSEIDAAIQTQGRVEYKATKRLVELGTKTDVADNQGATPIDWVNRYGEMARKRFKEVVCVASDV